MIPSAIKESEGRQQHRHRPLQHHPQQQQLLLNLLVDGCNGPIRFREQNLVSNDLPTRHAALSILNCDHSCCDTLKEKQCRKKVSTTNTSRRKKLKALSTKREADKQQKDGTGSIESGSNSNLNSDATVATCASPLLYERLEIIPLTKYLLHHQSNDRYHPFHNMTVIFDGVSQTKRPNLPSNTKSMESDKIDDETPLTAVTTNTSGKKYELTSKFRIEITGLYDETDNVIVEKIVQWKQQQQQQHNGLLDKDKVADYDSLLSKTLEQQLVVSSNGTLQISDKHPVVANITTVTLQSTPTVTVVQRSDQGPGRARSILQPHGLLRPESPLCLFQTGFGSQALHQDSKGVLSKLLNHSRVGKNIFKSVEEVVLSSDSMLQSPYVPIVVVTDDIFLRQRVVALGAFVMTFRQFWILLLEAQHRMQSSNNEENDSGCCTPSINT